MKQNELLWPARPERRYFSGNRCISVPSKGMKVYHRGFLDLVEACADIPDSTREVIMTGLRHGATLVGHALRHKGKRYFYKLDLSDAFGSVKEGKLIEALVWARCFPREAILERANRLVSLKHGENHAGIDEEDVLEAARDYLRTEVYMKFTDIENEGLFQGYPASPALFAIYAAYTIDLDLSAIAKAHGLVYTRYADDLVFSGPFPIGASVRKVIRKVLIDAGFSVAHHKSYVLDNNKVPVVITGIGIQRRGLQLFLPQRKRNKIEGLLRAACAGGDISKSCIYGSMSEFVHVYPRDLYPMPRSAKRIWDLYDEWRSS